VEIPAKAAEPTAVAQPQLGGVFSRRQDGASERRSPTARRLGIGLVTLALVAGLALRVARLDSVPPGLDQDEACNGYDAYSLLETGRDHHGNVFPLAIQAFNDFRMPLFDYSLVPIVGTLGLKVWTVRLGAAIWGTADLLLITLIAGLSLGLPGAIVAAVLGAVSPWHLVFSRFGHEAITSSATVSAAMACMLLWLNRRASRWLLLSGMFFGLSLYSYSITKAFVPLMIGLLGLMYWKEFKQARRAALAALGIVAIAAMPQIYAASFNGAWLDRLRQNSFFGAMWPCPFCDPVQRAAANQSLPYRLVTMFAGGLGYLTPSFLFLNGDRGDHWTLLHPPGFGQLLPEQALLIVLALAAFASARHRKLAVLFAGWLILSIVPAALTVPVGALLPEPQVMATPWVMRTAMPPGAPLTPALLLAHPDSRHDILSAVPWILISALGFVVLLEWTSRLPLLKLAAAGLVVAGAMFHGSRFVESYFTDYAVVAAPYFQYGMEQVVRGLAKVDDGRSYLVITDKINEPYIYVLFYRQYPPAWFIQWSRQAL
jgi:hypothetical protein